MDLTSCIAVIGMIIVAVRIAAAGEETLGPEDAMGHLTGRRRNTFLRYKYRGALELCCANKCGM